MKQVFVLLLLALFVLGTLGTCHHSHRIAYISLSYIYNTDFYSSSSPTKDIQQLQMVQGYVQGVFSLFWSISLYSDIPSRSS